jgi:hypothetical protein
MRSGLFALILTSVWISLSQYIFTILFSVTDYGLDDRMIGIRVPAGAGNFSLRHRVQTDSGAHPVSHPMGTGGSFPGGKAAGA